jgi:hypothetical protein
MLFPFNGLPKRRAILPGRVLRCLLSSEVFVEKEHQEKEQR